MTNTVAFDVQGPLIVRAYNENNEELARGFNNFYEVVSFFMSPEIKNYKSRASIKKDGVEVYSVERVVIPSPGWCIGDQNKNYIYLADEPHL